jgi:hypothetical protein
MKRDLERRINALEETARPRIISTLVDFISHVEEHPDEAVELSPALQELAEK